MIDFVKNEHILKMLEGISLEMLVIDQICVIFLNKLQSFYYFKKLKTQLPSKR